MGKIASLINRLKIPKLSKTLIPLLAITFLVLTISVSVNQVQKSQSIRSEAATVTCQNSFSDTFNSLNTSRWYRSGKVSIAINRLSLQAPATTSGTTYSEIKTINTYSGDLEAEVDFFSLTGYSGTTNVAQLTLDDNNGSWVNVRWVKDPNSYLDLFYVKNRTNAGDGENVTLPTDKSNFKIRIKRVGNQVFGYYNIGQGFKRLPGLTTELNGPISISLSLVNFAATQTTTAQFDNLVVRCPAQNTTTSVGSYFFYWHNCPSGNCDTSKMPYLPSNQSFYSATNLDWYKAEFKDYVNSRIDAAIAVSWGSLHPSLTWFRDTSAVPLMVRAIQETSLPLKIGFLDDTNSVVAEWNLDNGRDYTSPTDNPSALKMPLSNDANWSYFYDRKIKPFFTMVPQNLWWTHNGQSPNQGGRPILLIYDAARSFSDLEYSDEMWYAIKNAFKRDFKNSQGADIDPFVVLDYSWFDFNSQKSALEGRVDGRFIWAGGNNSIPRVQTLRNFTTASIDPGLICPSGQQYEGCVSSPRNISLTGANGDEGARLRSMFETHAQNVNLALIETWNELWEATLISRASNYPTNEGGTLPNHYYLNLTCREISGIKNSGSCQF